MKTYLVKEIFDTLQGEGARAGSRSIFVRLSNCNLWNGHPEDRDRGRAACALWCDTDFVGGDRMEAGAIVERVRALWPVGKLPGERWVVLTGGEPGLQVDETLLHAFKVEGLRVAIETNGTVDLPFVGLDWVCVSPKLGAENNLKVRHGAEMKVILPGVVNGSGWPFDTLSELEKSTHFDHYFVQPQDPIDPDFVEMSHLSGDFRLDEDHAYNRNVARCVKYVKMNPRWRLCLQSHKLAGLR